MRLTATLAVLVVTACGGPEAATDAGDRDAGLDASTVTVCERIADCLTSEPCTTAVCAPGDPSADARGCIVSSLCGADEVCEDDRCVPYCETPDADGDGHAAIACGGDDCDDADPNRYPGNPEVCDGSHDEDCDPTTVAGVSDGDQDGDGAIARTCCNDDVCGGDCDDSLREIFPGAREICNAVDDDCDGPVDEAGAFCPVGTCADRRCRSVGWERVYGEPGGDHIDGLTVDDAGNAYALMFVTGAPDLDGDGSPEVGAAYYVVSVSPEGRHRWHAETGLTGRAVLAAGEEALSSMVVADDTGLRWLSTSEGALVRAIPVAAPDGWTSWSLVDAGWAGNSLYVGGVLRRGDPATSTLEEAVLLLRFDSAGVEEGRRVIELAGGRVRLDALSVSAAGLAVVGWASAPVDLGAGVSAVNVFAARLDVGLSSAWAVSGLPNASTIDVAISSVGDVAIAGRASGEYTPFWGGPPWPGSYGDTHAFAITLAPDGSYRWHRVYHGGSSQFLAADFDDRDGLMVCGTFSGDLDVTPRGRLSAVGTSDAFFAIFDVRDGFVLRECPALC